MAEKKSHPRARGLALGMLAEDLQGAVAVACRLRQRGLNPAIVRGRSELAADVDAVVVDLDLHHVDSDPTGHVQKWAQWLREQECERIEVRLHAELRGNPVALIEGISTHDGLADTALLVVPGYPTAGRACVDGHLLAPMPSGPGLDVDVCSTLQLKNVEAVPLAVLNLGAEEATQWVVRHLQAGKRQFVFDATVEAHLEVAAEVASALRASGTAVATASTGGWLRFFPDLGSDGYVLVVAPANHETDRVQLRRLAECSGAKALIANGTEAAKWTPQVAREIVASHRIIVIHEVDSGGLDPWAVAEQLATSVRSILDASVDGNNACLGVVTSGGLTTTALVGALEGEGLLAGLELEPLCPTARVTGGPFHDLRLLSKASGTGSEDTLLRMTRQILGV